VSCSSYKVNKAKEESDLNIAKKDMVERFIASRSEDEPSIQDLSVRVKKLEKAIIPISQDIPGNVNIGMAEMAISFREKFGVEVYSHSD
jgi:hypothetical protein